MADQLHNRLFDIRGRVAVVTGGTGVLGGAMAAGLAEAGASVAVIGRRVDRARAHAAAIEAAGGTAMAVHADVLQKDKLATARDGILEKWGRIDILVNAAGGNRSGATVAPEASLFELPVEAFQEVLDLNLLGTWLPIQVFGVPMAEGGCGAIVNISSMAAQRAITRVVAYSAAKAGVENLTRWLAVELAQRYGGKVRVNALAPGFFIAEQNRDLLVAPDGSLTERGNQIIRHTPMARFGEPDDLIGVLLWLVSDASRFVTGAVVPIDGGFGASAGV
jgi:NAD(P)-dependent dehydrogenase (short-subunit alcohol dehydrogenase family)